MAKPNVPSTLFEHLHKIRGGIECARADVILLRTSIRGRASVDDKRTPAEDLRIQLRQSLVIFDELLDALTPLADFHLDQPIRTVSSKKRTREVATRRRVGAQS